MDSKNLFLTWLEENSRKTINPVIEVKFDLQYFQKIITSLPSKIKSGYCLTSIIFSSLVDPLHVPGKDNRCIILLFLFVPSIYELLHHIVNLRNLIFNWGKFRF